MHCFHCFKYSFFLPSMVVWCLERFWNFMNRIKTINFVCTLKTNVHKTLYLNYIKYKLTFQPDIKTLMQQKQTQQNQVSIYIIFIPSTKSIYNKSVLWQSWIKFFSVLVLRRDIGLMFRLGCSSNLYCNQWT